MKYPALILLMAAAYFQSVSCQPVNIMVKNINKNEILDDGSQSGNWFTYIQQTYDDKNRLVLERFYDGKAKIQDSYTWYYYNDEGRLKSVENYGIDKNPRMLKQIKYNGSGDTLKIIVFSGIQGSFKKVSEKTFAYSTSGQLIQSKTLAPDNSLIETTKYSFRSGSKVPAKISIVNNSASPFKEKIAIEYNDSSKMPQSLVKQINQTAIRNKQKINISYNKKGKPLEERYQAGSQLIKRKVYEYSSGVELKKYFEEDGKGKLTELYTIETYFHKANLDVRSFFEK